MSLKVVDIVDTVELQTVINKELVLEWPLSMEIGGFKRHNTRTTLESWYQGHENKSLTVISVKTCFRTHS